MNNINYVSPKIEELYRALLLLNNNKLFGANSKMAKFLGVKTQNITNWRSGLSEIPYKHALKIQEITDNQILAINLSTPNRKNDKLLDMSQIVERYEKIQAKKNHLANKGKKTALRKLESNSIRNYVP
jgi:DNA-binding transcriptional regulator YdaS (Cro superfamily)